MAIRVRVKPSHEGAAGLLAFRCAGEFQRLVERAAERELISK